MAGTLQAYRTWLGFYKGFCKLCGWDNAGVVAAANHYAKVLGEASFSFSMGKCKGQVICVLRTCAFTGCPEPPPIERKTVGKMGLKGQS